MSPLPSPTPLRRALLRVIFSPAGLLCGFVALIIVTCPGARGEDAIALLAGPFAGPQISSVDLARFDMPVASRQAAPATGRPVHSDRAPISSARSATPSERARRVAGGVDRVAFPSARAASPVLVDPLFSEAAMSPAAPIRPLTGPPVGIRPPVAGR